MTKASSTNAATVAVCIITLYRPHGLARLLDSIDRQIFDAVPTPELTIIVVDNDSGGSARPVVEAYRRQSLIQVSYAVEEDRGIPFARNLCVSMVEQEVDFIAFIDDDEEASTHWLDELLRAQHSFGADIVSGSSEVCFPENAPAWIRNGGFFGTPHYRTGAKPRWASTRNILVRHEILEWVDGPFDELFALTGGSDIVLFSQLVARGARHVWCEEASVYDHIPSSRLSARWLIQRAYRTGNSKSLKDRKFVHRPQYLIKRLLTGSILMAIGLLILTPSALLGRRGLTWASWFVAHGAGMLSGLLGYRYQEYRVIHGD